MKRRKYLNTFQVRLSSDLKKLVDGVAKQEDRTPSDAIRCLIRDGGKYREAANQHQISSTG